MSSPAPMASGVLSKNPLPNVLLQLLERELSGTLVLETRQGEKSAVLLARGVPVKARTSEPVIYLGRLLVERGLITPEAEADALARVAKERCLLGQVLVERGVLRREQLTQALEEQVSRKLVWLAGLPDSSLYGFYEGVDYLQRFGGEVTPVAPLAAIWAGVRRFGPDSQVEAALERLGARTLRLHPDAAIKHFGLSPDEQAVLDVLRARPQPWESLIATGLLPPEQVRRLIYMLFISRHLDVGGRPIVPAEVAPSSRRGEHRPLPRRPRSEPSAPSVGPPRAPMGSFPGVDVVAEELEQRFREVDQQNYYEILGVDPEASSAQIQGAFFQLAKRFHPDKLPAAELELRKRASKVFARISEAHQVLSDDERRAEYGRLIKEGGASPAEQEKVQAVLRAAQHFQKAEILFKKREMVQAAQLARRAMEDDPEQVDYGAFHAWVSSHLPERQGSGQFDDLIATLDRAVEKEPENQRCRWYRGQLYKRVGDTRRALRDFRWLVDQNPNHVDALREVRLADMRRQTRTSTGRTHTGAGRRTSQPGKGASQAPAKAGSDDLGQIWGKLFRRGKDK
ncbi:MAG: DnaJ domain-containing protein [Polyangiaceae bacterium]|nr:DnaJ domain-containing protein [Polyangiaceae bacterium]MCW5790039.1 DnaJ domain-containing protein [Polyangiaceae bacterium]